jgi:hypothetical protein
VKSQFKPQYGKNKTKTKKQNNTGPSLPLDFFGGGRGQEVEEIELQASHSLGKH